MPLSWLEKHIGFEFFNPDLEVFSSYVREYQLYPDSDVKIITIAGTNGKGETTRRLAKHCFDQGKKFCQWTSPHLVDLAERMICDGQMIEEKDLFALFSKHYDQMNQQGIHLSFFEFLFAVFLDWAKEQKVQMYLIEVGLGGRLDASNVLDADLILLTSVSRDHQEHLGKRYDQILQEKLGVLREDSYFISALELNYLRERVYQKLSKTIKYRDLFEEGLLKTEDDFSLRNQRLAFEGFKTLFPHLMLEWREDFLFQMRSYGENECLFFPSHNVDGVRKLVHLLEDAHYNKLRNIDILIAAFSFRAEDDLSTILKILVRVQMKEMDVIVTSFSHLKAAKRERIKFLCQEVGLLFEPDYKEKKLFERKLGRVVVTGSNYFVGDVLAHFDHSIS